MKKEKNRVNKKQKLYIIIASSLAIIVIVTSGILWLVQSGKINANKDYKEPLNKNFSFLVENESTELKNDNIFTGQYEIYQKLLIEFKNKKSTLSDPYVVTNPFLISPQTALIMFNTTKKEKVTVTIKGKHNDDLTVNFESSKEHILPIYGLYGKYTNKVILTTESGEKKELDIKIDDFAPTENAEVLENKIENSNGEFYFGTSSLGTGNIALDNYGEIRWWLNIGYTKGMTMLQNGHILLSNADNGPDLTSTSGVVELDMLGYVHKNYEIEGGYHHDGYELENGNLIILTSKRGGGSLADYVVEVDRNTGKVVKDWSLKDIA